ncbi:RDD domain-containing protein [Mycolicibacterium thermoresistibile]|nr:RDD domain-containing protein [Mycolicibacterium thermoresistibile]SNW18003.1 RDD domain-containing protein [Mycolicibacterium thermoresistibile]
MLHGRQPDVALKLRNATRRSLGIPGSAYSGSMARATGSWLSGPSSASADDGYPGERLGFPEHGPGSIARFGRRLGALLIDWLIAYGLAALAMAFGWVSMTGLSTAVLVIWLVLGVVAVRAFGFTPGQYVLGLAVISIDGRLFVSIWRALVRNLLIVPVIPALFTNRDFRGMHDLLSGTAVVRR